MIHEHFPTHFRYQVRFVRSLHSIVGVKKHVNQDNLSIIPFSRLLHDITSGVIQTSRNQNGIIPFRKFKKREGFKVTERDKKKK